MPIPGGVYALQQSLSFYPRRRSNSLVPGTCDLNDPEHKAFNEAQRYFRENLKCTMGFLNEIIPSTPEKLSGVLILEAKEEVEHNGLFILMKGLSLPAKKRKIKSVEGAAGAIIRRPVTSLKFTVLGNTCGGEGKKLVVEARSRESYPLELDIPQSPDGLPPPLVTSEGRLMYRLQVFMTTSEGKHVNIGEELLEYQGHYDLQEGETEKHISIQQVIQSKRSYLGLGRKKTANVDFSVGRSGFLPEESIEFTFIGSSQEKSMIQLECKIELVQKVWYQVIPKVGKRMSVRMKVNLISVTSANKLVIEPGNDVVWEGSLTVPKGQTPTYKFDFMNSVSYTLRVSVVLNGDKEGRVTSEAPIYIGTERSGERRGRRNESDDEDAKKLVNYDDDDDEEDTSSPSRFSAGTPLVIRPSQSMTFVPARTRAESLSSMDSFRSGALSLFRMPPSYSQLSSRRSTLETLPPPYGEVELKESPYLRGGCQEYNEEDEQTT